MADEETTEGTNEDDGGESTGSTTTEQQFGDDVEKWKNFSRQNEKAAKAERERNERLERELEEFKRSQMSEQEKAVADARAEGRAEGLAEANVDIAIAEFKAATAGRLDDEQMTTLLDGLDVKAFLGDDSRVDPAKVAKFVDTIAPTAARSVDLGQGARSTSSGPADPLLATVQQFVGK